MKHVCIYVLGKPSLILDLLNSTTVNTLLTTALKVMVLSNLFFYVLLFSLLILISKYIFAVPHPLFSFIKNGQVFFTIQLPCKQKTIKIAAKYLNTKGNEP